MRGSSTYSRCVAILLGSCFTGRVLAQSAPPADAIVTSPLARKVSKQDRQAPSNNGGQKATRRKLEGARGWEQRWTRGQRTSVEADRVV